MRHLRFERRLGQGAARALWILAVGCMAPGSARAQEHEDYIVREGQRLMIVVHILGEVKKPGEYTVEDRTTVMELLSKAGGPTEFADLGAVTLTRVEPPSGYTLAGTDGGAERTHVVRVDLDRYLEGKSTAPPPVLQPGDIVDVRPNGWFQWRRVSGIARDVSVVASAYFLYLRAAHNN